VTDNTLWVVLTDVTATDAYARRSPINHNPDIQLIGKRRVRNASKHSFLIGLSHYEFQLLGNNRLHDVLVIREKISWYQISRCAKIIFLNYSYPAIFYDIMVDYNMQCGCYDSSRIINCKINSSELKRNMSQKSRKI